MDKKPLFSVILTSYNSGTSIIDTIQSIQDQKGLGVEFDMELIIVDDCSTDTTTQIYQEHQWKYFSTPSNSGGPNTGRNIGLRNSKGDWVIIADHDDIWHNNRLQIINQYTGHADIITSGYIVQNMLSQQSLEIRQKTQDSYCIYKENETFYKLISKDKINKQLTYLGSIAFKRKTMNYFFEEKYGMVDFDWISELFRENSSIYINECLYTRIQDGKNLSRNERYRRLDYEVSINYLSNLPKSLEPLIEKGIQGVNGTMGRYYYSEGKMKQARKYLLKAKPSFKTIIYYLTTFIGSNFINKSFKVFD